MVLMTNFLDLVKRRYSCRSYGAQRVEREKLDYLLECVRMAPSAVNRQPWRLRVVSSEEGRALMQRCYDRAWFKSAPVYVLVSVSQAEAWVRADGKCHGDIDAAIATEHLCLAAAEQGLATCWVCNFDAALCRELFALAPQEVPVAIVSVGYAADEPAEKKRKALSEIVVRRD